MKNKLAKIITISCLFLVVSLFLVLLFSNYDNSNEMVYVIDNDNLNKMDDNVSILFERKKLEDEVKEDELIEETKEDSFIDKIENNEQVVEELVGIKEDVIEEEESTKEEIHVEEEVEPTVTSLAEEREVLQTVVGNLTGYGPDCVGCGGHTSTGFNLNESIYYEDSEFGTVRILAADPSFPFYSIIRVSNVPTMDDFIGIVLDRGGNVGFGRGTLFDLAFESESSPNLVPLTRNVTFELLRSGR